MTWHVTGVGGSSLPARTAQIRPAIKASTPPRKANASQLLPDERGVGFDISGGFLVVILEAAGGRGVSNAAPRPAQRASSA